MKRYSFSLSRVLAPKNGTRTRHVLLKQSESQFKKFQQGPENFIENLGNDPGGTRGGGEESFGLFFCSAIIRKKLGPVTRFTSQSAMFSITLFGRECGLQVYSIAQCFVVCLCAH